MLSAWVKLSTLIFGIVWTKNRRNLRDVAPLKFPDPRSDKSEEVMICILEPRGMTLGFLRSRDWLYVRTLNRLRYCL